MSLVSFRAKNHRQQSQRRGAVDAVDDRSTRPEVFEPLAQEFGPFTLDVAASQHNAKCPRFFTLQQDGLKQSWAGEVVWCNPPYSDLRAWTTKALSEISSGCRRVVMLLPANRCEQSWWQELIESRREKTIDGVRCFTRFLRGRPRFDRPNFEVPVKGDRPPFGLVVVVFERAGKE